MTVAELYRSRPRSRLLRGSAWLAFVVVVASWAVVGADVGSLLQPRARANLARFLGELIPPVLRDDPWTVTGWAAWLGAHGDDLALATVATLALSIAAMGLASIAAVPAAVLGARTLATAAPFTDALPSGPWHRAGQAVRAILVLARAVPEYLLAFLLVAVLGPGAWPALLALAVHNAGILGRLWGEAVEDVEPAAPAALWRIGGGRGAVVLHAVLPTVAGRGTLYLFTRWETAVRESTVLGMLGFVSLGWFVQDARARLHYDELALYVGLGAALVLAGDLLAVQVRRWLREAG
ncbi:MAG: phosphonate transport system permease protein [Myxococcota bacterium]|jgi:phosphonate transport system permease protein